MTGRLFAARAGYSCGLALLVFLFGSRGLQNAVAEGETRTISLHHIHTGEDITITYKRDGRYDDAAIKKLDWFLRDWRRGEATDMDPRLIDLVWEVQRETGTERADPGRVRLPFAFDQRHAAPPQRGRGALQPAYSRPRHGLLRSRRLARTSPRDRPAPGARRRRLLSGVRLALRAHGRRRHPHVAAHDARSNWCRVFPDGRTVQIPIDGKPLPGYALALADVTKRGAVPSANSLEAARNAGINVDTLRGEQRAARPPPILSPSCWAWLKTARKKRPTRR